MKYKLLPYFLVVLILASCSSAYKASQTPDDVYYSPAQPAVAKEEKEEDKYEEYTKSDDERYLRMKVRNRYRWQSIDDYAYWNDVRYYPSSYSYYHNNWYNWYVWNNWNNPFISVGYSNHCCCILPYNNIKNGYYQYPVKPTPVTRPDLNTYRNTRYSNSNSVGNSIKKVFSNDGRNYNNRNENRSSSGSTDRTYSPSSSGSSSSGSGSSGGGVSRPGRN